MLSITLDPRMEEGLVALARNVGRPADELAREWIEERYRFEATGAEMVSAAARGFGPEAATAWHGIATDACLLALDAEDGGYDWGPEGPPAVERN